MASIQAAYNPLEQAAAAFTAAAGEVDVLLSMVDGSARTDSGDATVNAGIVHIAQDLRGGLAWTATTLRAEGERLRSARFTYDATDSSLMPLHGQGRAR